MTATILYFLLPLFITLSLIPIIKLLAKKYKLYDIPEDRKVHTKPIPALGGVAIFTSFYFSIYFFNTASEIPGIPYLLIGGALLFFMGLWDDLKGLSAKSRLVVQFLVAAISYAGGFALLTDYGILGLGTLPTAIQFLSTIFFIVLLINAFNLIDGINGLAGGLGLVTSLSFSYLFAIQGAFTWSIIALIISGSLLGFLKFNFIRGNIFMGDNGSTFLGLIIALFFLQYSNTPKGGIIISEYFAQGMCLIALPVFDLIRVSMARMAKGHSPFQADKTHIHHLLLKNYESHKKVTLLLLTFQFTLVIISQLFLTKFGILTQLLFIGLAYMIFIKAIRISHDLTAIKSMEQERRQLGFLQ